MPTDSLINPKAFLGSETVSLNELLSQAHFEVPDYQRDYSWGEEQIGALWEDLATTANAAYAAGITVQNPLPHFLGPIVVLKDTSDSTTPLEVMDGQQRLVTLTALISVLREQAQGISNADNRNAWRSSLTTLLGTWESGSFRPRLKLAREHPYYQKIVCTLETKEEKENYVSSLASAPKGSVRERIDRTMALLRKAVQQFAADCGNFDDAARIRLFKAVLDLPVFLRMTVHERGVAYEVFEGLNARGLELQQADLIKNRLYAVASHQNSKPAVVSAWDRLVTAIEGQATLTLTELLHFHYLVRVGEAKQATLYKKLNDHLGMGRISAFDYATDVANVAEKVQQLLDGGSQLSAEAVRNVEATRDTLGNKYALVFWVAGAVRHPFPSQEMEEVVRLAHHFAFRRFSVEGEKQGRYSSEVEILAREYANSPDQPAQLAAAMRLKSADAVFKDRFKRYSVPTNKMGFYAIEMIENHLSTSAGTYVHPQSPSQHLEHIMPRRPGSGWPNVSGDPAYETYLPRLGNLLVLEADINQHVKNKNYSYKKSNSGQLDYAHSHLKLPATLSAFEMSGEWDFRSIEARQLKLAEEFALAVWPL